MKREMKKLKKCRKCGNKNPQDLYYETLFSGRFLLSTDAYGRNDDVDWGGYNFLEDFIDNMLTEMGKRKFIGCNNCIKLGE